MARRPPHGGRHSHHPHRRDGARPDVRAPGARTDGSIRAELPRAEFPSTELPRAEPPRADGLPQVGPGRAPVTEEPGVLPPARVADLDAPGRGTAPLALGPLGDRAATAPGPAPARPVGAGTVAVPSGRPEAARPLPPASDGRIDGAAPAAVPALAGSSLATGPQLATQPPPVGPPAARTTSREGPPDRAGSTCTAPQLRRFIKSRAWIPMHELRRRFGIDGGEDDVTPVDGGGRRVFVGLPEREAGMLGELLRSGEVGYELSLDPASPIVIGIYPMRPITRN